MGEMTFRMRAFCHAQASFDVAQATGSLPLRSYEDHVIDAMDELAAKERAESARRLAAMKEVVAAARKVSDASLSMAAATSGGAAKVNVQDVAEAAAAMDEGWLALDTALAALDAEVGNG